jgi:hypothetical protein
MQVHRATFAPRIAGGKAVDEDAARGAARPHRVATIVDRGDHGFDRRSSAT